MNYTIAKIGYWNMQASSILILHSISGKLLVSRQLMMADWLREFFQFQHFTFLINSLVLSVGMHATDLPEITIYH